MKKIFSFTKRKRGASPSASETGSLTSAGGYELRDRDLGKMYRAAYTGDLAKLRQLCKKSDPNQLDKEQRTPLHLACANGHPELVTYLVENQSKVNLCDNDSRSPLMKAVQCQQERCATILLEHNADTNLEDINGNTALHLSALIPAVALATELLEHGADLEAKNKEGCTPLHLAVCESHLDMVDFILKHSADINAKDKSGRTALMIAASNGQINLVKLLIENNADTFLKDNQGWTADDFAANNEHHACSHLIIQHGSKQRLKQSPAFHGVNIIKGGPMFGSPERVIGDGFPLGGPALDREVTDDESSQAESESRISNKAPSNTSWCSDDEEEEPQRPQKPSLAVLMNVSNQTKKTVPEATSIFKTQRIAIAQPSKSDSKEDSCLDSDEEELLNRSLPKPLSHTPSLPHPTFASPGSLPQPSQMASTVSSSFKKEESEEKECKDISEGSVKQLTPLNKTENQTQYLPSNVGTSAGRKDLMSELGLEEDDALSGFDSESSSESPREEATNPLHSCVASKQIGIIKDDQREDLVYIPSFKRRSKDYKMTKLEDAKGVDWPVGQVDHSVNLLLQKPTTEAKEILKPAFTECVKNPQPDLMKELGLDDADDIEDVSDFDSSSTSPKPSKCFQESKHDNDQPDQLMVLPKEAESPLQKAAQMEFTTKHIASADEADSQTHSSKIVHDKRAQTNVSSVEKHAGPLEQTLLPQSKVEREQEPALGTLPFKGIQVELNCEDKKQEVEEEKFKSTQSRNHDETDKITMRCDAERSVVKNEGLSEKNQHLKKTLVPKATPVLKNEKGTIQPSKSVNTKETSKSAQDPCKGKNMASDGENIKDAKKNETKKISKPSSAKSLNPQQLSPSNGSNGKAHQVFDDSTISETSQDEGRSNPKLGNNRDMIARQADLPDDLEDLTLSSDTATEDCDSPSSAHRNAVLLIEQLTVEGQDTVSLIKIQNIVHEYERLIKKENGRYELLLSKVKTLESERKELQKVIEETREMKSLLEHQKVEWESDLNSVRFTLKQEEEKRKSAEMLYDKSRDQLRKKEDQCCKEMEGKQQLELNLRNLELELRTLRNSLKQVEEERSEGQRLLSQERSARVLQEGLLNSHLWKQKEEEEKKKMIVKREETLTQTSEIGEREKELSHRNHSLQEEISVLKLELDHVRTRNQEEEGKTIEENEALKERLEDLRRDLKLNEEALTQTVFQYSGQFNAMKAESALLASKVEQEKQSKERLETELESIRCRLASAIQELEHSRASKSDGERTFQRERDDWLRSQDKLNYDLANVREAHNNLSQQLTKAEAKANSLENELHRITLSLREKTLLLESTQRDLNQTQCRAKELERTLQIEKDQVSKSAVKQETLQERLAQVHSENMLLRQQLEDVQNKGILKEKAVNETQDRFSEIFSKLRDDTEKKVSMVEDRNKELITMSNDLREQIHQIESDKVKREAELRQVQQELVDALKKLCMSESCLENTIRIRTNLEEEKQRLLNEINKLESKVVDSEDRYTQSERRIQELRSMLDEKGREVMAVTQKLQEFSTLSSGTEKTVKQFEEHVQMLEIENARLEATTKQQNGKIEMLQKEHQESASVHARLEDLITNLQSTKIGLEDQLNQQVHQQTVLSQTAKDSHNLWEEELKSRSRLGVRLAQLDREKSELTEQIESERKKVKKVLDLKRSLETRLEQEMKRNTELVKEASGMKKLLKSAKKKLKEYNGGELGSSQLSTFHGELKNNQYEPENQAIRLKAKIDELSQNLEAESTKCSQLESTNRDLREQLSSVKILHKNHERLEKSKRQLEEEVANLRRHVETNMTDHNQMGQYKREIEERARQEIRQKLEEVNMFLQTQAASQETLEQIRATNDASLRNQMEHRIRDLESELSRIKSTQQDSMCQKESTQTELDRYKDLYSEEIKIRKSLAAKLDRANERLAEANTKLLTERQRSKSLIANSFVNGSLSPSPFMDTSQLGTNLAFNRSLGFGGNFLAPVGNGMSSNNRVEAYLAKMQRELEKNITKELDQANAELESGSRLSPVGSTTGSLRNITGDQDPVSRATQQYLEVLKKNSKI